MGLNETVRKGAFAKTLDENGGEVPILADHDKQIGWGTKGEEDNKGLLVDGILDITNTPEARSKWALMKMASKLGKAKMGLSIGFMVEDEEIQKKKDEPDLRIIKQIRLLEYSITAFPANPKAGVIGVRNIGDLIGSVDQLSAEERTLLLAELRRYEAVPPSEPDYVIHSILKALEETNQRLQTR
jgi:HK97 family phage prohead protease